LSATVAGVDKAGATTADTEISRSIGTGGSQYIPVSGRSGATGATTAGSESRNGSLQLSGSLEVAVSHLVDLGIRIRLNNNGRSRLQVSEGGPYR
jgi:hypothetical protein